MLARSPGQKTKQEEVDCGLLFILTPSQKAQEQKVQAVILKRS